MNHDEYWRKVKHEAEERVHALAYVMEHGEPDEAARAILALGEWTHAHHELREHGDVAAAGAAAQ